RAWATALFVVPKSSPSTVRCRCSGSSRGASRPGYSTKAPLGEPFALSLPSVMNVSASSGVSQQRPFEALSCTNGGPNSAGAELGGRSRKRLDPRPFTLSLLPAPPLSTMTRRPFGVPVLSRYAKPLFFLLQRLPAGAVSGYRNRETLW